MELSLKSSCGISCLCFNKWDNQYISLSTWGSSVEIYNAKTGFHVQSHKFDCPQLFVIWADKNMCISGGSDGVISANGVFFGAHDSPISSLCYVEARKVLVSSSFDGMVKVWEIKTHSLICENTVQYKVIGMSLAKQSMVVCGCSERAIFTFDVGDPKSIQVRSSSLPYNTSCVSANDENIAIGSFEGRIAVESFEGKNYAFKAHYESIDDTRYVFPVNVMRFHSQTGHLATGGGDGKVIIWDLEQKRKIKEYGPYPSSISSLSFSDDGTLLAISSSYGFEKGDVQHERDMVLIVEIP